MAELAATNLFESQTINADHKDLIHDVAYDFYGERMATCSSDQYVKVWDTDGRGGWRLTGSWKAHHGSVWKVTWAHPEFGQVLATCSFDRTVAIWEEVGDTTAPGSEKGLRTWVKRSNLVDSRTSVTDVKFGPKHLGLLLVTCSADGIIRVNLQNIHASPVSDIAYSLINRDVLLSCGYDKIMHVYDIRMQNVVSTITTLYPLKSLAINIDNQVALGTKNGYILVYDLRDLNAPFKVLRGHNEEVCKVAFQPSRKKNLNDTSLREDVEVNSSFKLQSPARGRTSDTFFINDTPPRHEEASPQGLDNKVDSFLVMMGLDKSNVDVDEDGIKSVDNGERRSDKFEFRYCQLDAEKNISKISTPITSRTADNLQFTSPLMIPNGAHDKNLNTNTPDIKLSNLNVENVNSKNIEELKDFIKLTLADVADDNRNYFLHIMMALTKQKLFLEKQLFGMNEQIHTLIQNQNMLVETNRKLALQIEQLKAQQNLF